MFNKIEIVRQACAQAVVNLKEIVTDPTYRGGIPGVRAVTYYLWIFK